MLKDFFDKNAIKNIGWIGTGVMGHPMCNYLVKSKKYNVFVYNRTMSKCDDLIKEGASCLELTPEGFKSHDLDVLILMVSRPVDVKETLMGKHNLVSLMKPNSLVIDHTSSSPALAEEINEYAKNLGTNVQIIDAPVTGGDIGAKAGTLSIMVGCDNQLAYDRATEIMNHYSKMTTLLGKSGSGHHTKMANNLALAINISGMCEA